MKISCIIPTFNRRDFLVEALTSVFNQTIKPSEVLLINNGREPLVLPPAWVDKVRVYNIVVGAGASQARNFGAAVATGDYLAFLDDDDLWGQTYLEQVTIALERGAECVVSRLDKMIGGQIIKYKNAAGRLTVERLLVQNPGVTGSNLVVKKELYLAIGGCDAELPTSNDKDLMIKVLQSGRPVEVLPDNQAIYREHAAEKITNPEKSARGVRRFTEKYRQLMGWRAYIINRKKYYKHRLHV